MLVLLFRNSMISASEMGASIKLQLQGRQAFSAILKRQLCVVAKSATALLVQLLS